jgi:hypothetical protein
MKSCQAKNMVPGVILSPEVIGKNTPDPFMDSFEEERLECCAILDKIDWCDSSSITITFDKGFLKDIVRTRVLFIKELEEKDFNANGHRAAGKDFRPFPA